MLKIGVYLPKLVECSWGEFRGLNWPNLHKNLSGGCTKVFSTQGQSHQYGDSNKGGLAK